MVGRSGLRAAPLNALRSFEAAARHLSFVAAAEELGVTASAISVQVKRLEARIGRPLFERGHRSVHLSEMGARLAPGLAAIFLDLDRLLVDVVDPVADSIQISAMPSFATRWLAPRLAGFAALRPSHPIRLVGADALVDFDRDGVDIGLRYGPGGYAPLHFERIAAARAFPVCSPAFRAAHLDRLGDPSGLAGLPLLTDETSLRARDLPSWPNWFAAAGITGKPPGRGPLFDSLHMALAAAVAGQGVALGLTPLVDDDLASGALVRLFETELPSPYAFWFVCREDRLRERKIRAFRDWILAEAGG
ncbi:MAG TPA: LysR substrate-binding domain-containing protein [Aliidongia sp.]|uniref:LysR substrate-binding domain-containing protein n=1 Tax=Aliidongia sp. TaxID=1914230 RepID=UPI002DDCBCD5|nr:LysR substrate-binding domain-containing protein [Aliidongia sp.]HEV2676986.1 LysR substrate-binding domain-containing protein [Aliidongia sp.]